ncbi:MAG TPA: hypothetical protein VHD32_00035 [Candidatus Didemnitutus sp.]|nr:hypothetical protein [Candidatus Didemnitutus sp.]
MLRLLECYVLRAIGYLGEKEAATLALMAPSLQSALKADGAWYEIVEKAMHLPANMPELVRDMWAKNQKIAEANGAVLAPQAFAEMFVDDNLV